MKRLKRKAAERVGIGAPVHRPRPAAPNSSAEPAMSKWVYANFEASTSVSIKGK